MKNKIFRPVITIDGPAASGKGTITKKIAKEYNLFYMETGFFYRVIGNCFLNNPTKQNLKKFLKGINKEEFLINTNTKKQLYNEEVAEKASHLAKLKDVREFVLVKQLETLVDYPKNFKGIILEGRDCGTVIAPDADIKFFLTANLEIRAKRRFLQLIKKNKKILYENVLYDLRSRDKNDTTRKNSPLVKAKGAIEVDCSSSDIEETIMIVKKFILSKLPYFK